MEKKQKQFLLSKFDKLPNGHTPLCHGSSPSKFFIYILLADSTLTSI